MGFSKINILTKLSYLTDMTRGCSWDR